MCRHEQMQTDTKLNYIYVNGFMNMSSYECTIMEKCVSYCVSYFHCYKLVASCFEVTADEQCSWWGSQITYKNLQPFKLFLLHAPIMCAYILCDYAQMGCPPTPAELKIAKHIRGFKITYFSIYLYNFQTSLHVVSGNIFTWIFQGVSKICVNWTVEF